MRRHVIPLLSLLLVLTGLALPAAGQGPIDFDLRGWTPLGPGGDWQVSADGLEVIQQDNGSPFFFVSPETVIDATITGTFEVETTNDDDYVGFVFGFTAPTETDTHTYDYVVLSWKQTDQGGFGGCTAPAGFTLARVQGTLGDSPDERIDGSDFTLDTHWCQEQEVDDPRYEVLATAWDPDGGWADNTEYAFALTYTATTFSLELDGQEVLSATGTFPEGRFGFYNYSQPGARYSGFAQQDPAPTPTPTDTPQPGEPGTSRLPGGEAGDAVEVADQVCEFLVADGMGTQVAIARNDDFADALAGSQLPYVECILFTDGGPSATLDPRTRAEVDRALGGDGVVYLLGGVNAVSEAVQDELDGAGYEVRRLFGPTRFETAEAVAQETIFDLGQEGLPPRDVVIGYGYNWPDAITAGAWVHARAGALLVLSDTDTLHPAAQRIISQSGADRTVLVGGQGVLGPAVEAAVPNPQRVAGVNRMATAVEVAEGLWPEIPASGEDFVFVNLDRPDAWTLALAAAPLAAAIDGPELGVRTSNLPAETEQYLLDLGVVDPSRVILGDLTFIDDDVVSSIEVITGG